MTTSRHKCPICKGRKTSENGTNIPAERPKPLSHLCPKCHSVDIDVLADRILNALTESSFEKDELTLQDIRSISIRYKGLKLSMDFESAMRQARKEWLFSLLNTIS